MAFHDRTAPRIAVIGAGPAGIAALIKFGEAGFTNLTCFEKAGDLGGSWRDNRYPGLTCDVPSQAYRYSFEPNAEWTNVCAPGAEIHAYLKGVVEKYDIARLIRFNSGVVSLERFGGEWKLEASDGFVGQFDFVVSAMGILHEPFIPALEGLETFKGKCFHSLHWDQDVALEGKRAGVVGTGSTACQIIGAITPAVDKLSVFQRTPQWMLPLQMETISEEKKAIYRSDPSVMETEFQQLNDMWTTGFSSAVIGTNLEQYQALEAMSKSYLNDNVADPELRQKLTPDYKVLCKRIVFTPNFYQAIQAPNVDLVTTGIAKIVPEGIVTDDGKLHELDVLVLATGFKTNQVLEKPNITGDNGISLRDHWADRREAYRCVMVPGFSNLFILGGPNSPIGNFSWLLTAENQLKFCIGVMDMAVRKQVTGVAPKPEAAAAYNAEITEAIPNTIWASGCKSWYLDQRGKPMVWPWTYAKFADHMANLDEEDFVVS